MGLGGMLTRSTLAIAMYRRSAYDLLKHLLRDMVGIFAQALAEVPWRDVYSRAHQRCGLPAPPAEVA